MLPILTHQFGLEVTLHEHPKSIYPPDTWFQDWTKQPWQLIGVSYDILHCIQVGKPSAQWRDDPEGKPESAVSKAVRQTAKLASQVTKLVVKESGLVDEETAEMVGGAADAVQNQAEASRDATIADRLKMAG